MKKFATIAIAAALAATVILSATACKDKNTGQKTPPSFTYLYNNGSGHQQIGEYLQGALSTVGLTLNLENQEWNTFLNTRKEGNYTIARNGSRGL